MIEPIIIVVMGVIIGFIVIAMFSRCSSWAAWPAADKFVAMHRSVMWWGGLLQPPSYPS